MQVIKSKIQGKYLKWTRGRRKRNSGQSQGRPTYARPADPGYPSPDPGYPSPDPSPNPSPGPDPSPDPSWSGPDPGPDSGPKPNPSPDPDVGRTLTKGGRPTPHGPAGHPLPSILAAHFVKPKTNRPQPRRVKFISNHSS